MTPMKRILMLGSMLGSMIDALSADGRNMSYTPKTSEPAPAIGKTAKRSKVKAARKHRRTGKTA